MDRFHIGDSVAYQSPRYQNLGHVLYVSENGVGVRWLTGCSAVVDPKYLTLLGRP